MSFWNGKRILVTSGAGFLGSYVVERLRERGCREVFIPRSKDYDLTQLPAVQKLYADSRPDIVIHLVALAAALGLMAGAFAAFGWEWWREGKDESSAEEAKQLCSQTSSEYEDSNA